MDTFSILDQIIDSQKAEEAQKLDAVEIINNLFGELSERERDVIVRRYGLHGQGRETLENIGNVHSLTRERIRQIETSSVKKLQQLKNLRDYVSTLRNVIFQLLEEHGGLMEKRYLLDILVEFSLNGAKSNASDEEVHKNYLNFLITKLLHNEFEEIINSRHFKDAYKLKYQELSHFEEILQELLDKVKEAKGIFKTTEIISHIKQSQAYSKHESRFNVPNSLDISRALKFRHFNEDHSFVNDHKAHYTLLRSAKRIEQNKFGHWGLNNSREIKPKTINDKIYLILKNNGQPMHFTEIAEKINSIGFDSKQANAATVHNELILDKKYVLVGRGLYGLKEWGFKKGTVSDVIEEIFNESSAPLTRDDIINRVMEKRVVKKATIILALMNKDKFVRVDGGKYSLKQSA